MSSVGHMSGPSMVLGWVVSCEKVLHTISRPDPVNLSLYLAICRYISLILHIFIHKIHLCAKQVGLNQVYPSVLRSAAPPFAPFPLSLMIRVRWALCQKLDLSGAHPYGQHVQQSLQGHLTHLIVQHLTPCQDN